MQGRSSRGEAELGRVQGYAPCVRTQRVLWRPGESQFRCSRGAWERRIGQQPDDEDHGRKEESGAGRRSCCLQLHPVGGGVASLEPRFLLQTPLEVRGLHRRVAAQCGVRKPRESSGTGSRRAARALVVFGHKVRNLELVRALLHRANFGLASFLERVAEVLLLPASSTFAGTKTSPLLPKHGRYI